MFLDTFMDDASEGIMQNPIPDLEDLQLEYAVSLEAAYNDFMLEGCQVEFNCFCESSSIEAINEGIFDVIKKFFRTIWNFLKKIFGIKGSGGSGGGGNSGGGSTNTKDQKKEAEELDKTIKNQKKTLDNMKQLQQDNEKLIQQTKEELTEKMKEVQAKNINDISKKMKDARIKYEYKQKLVEVLSKIEDQKKIDEVKQQILDELSAEINKIKRTETYDPFVDICPISVDFVNDLIDKITEISESMRDDKLANNQSKFEDMQENAEYTFLYAICDVINKATYEMKERYGMSGVYLGTWQMDLRDIPSVATVSSLYKKLTAPRKVSLQGIIGQHNPSYDDYKNTIKQIRDSADDELKVDFQAILNQLAKDTMNLIKQYNSSNQTTNSMIARIKMRLITDLSQIIANMGIANKTARFYQLNGIRTIFHLTRKLDAELAKINDEKYIESLLQKRIMQA